MRAAFEIKGATYGFSDKLRKAASNAINAGSACKGRGAGVLIRRRRSGCVFGLLFADDLSNLGDRIVFGERDVAVLC